MNDLTCDNGLSPNSGFGKVAIFTWNVFARFSKELEVILNAFDPFSVLFEKFQDRVGNAAEKAAPGRKTQKKEM